MLLILKCCSSFTSNLLLNYIFLRYGWVKYSGFMHQKVFGNMTSNRRKKIIQGRKDQRAKKVVSDSPGLVDFAIGLVIFVLNLPDGQVLCFWEIQITEGW